MSTNLEENVHILVMITIFIREEVALISVVMANFRRHLHPFHLNDQ